MSIVEYMMCMIYISGPITTGGSTKEENLARMHTVAAQLKAMGMTVYNPASVYANDWTQHDYMMYYTSCILPACTAVYMMHGWQDSKGACIEHDYALAHGMHIIYE
jgi:hypothetical protein